MYHERKEFLRDLNLQAESLAMIMHGKLTKARVNQLKRILNKNYNLLCRLSEKEEITYKSFRYGYGGRSVFCNKMMALGWLSKHKIKGKFIFKWMAEIEMISINDVGGFCLEIYLEKNNIQI